MPSLTTDRLFKMIKTPIGNSRAKTPGAINSIGGEAITHSATHHKTLNILNTIDSANIQIDTATRSSYNDLTEAKNLLRESKTFDQSLKEPLTMRDLEIIDQNQFRLSNNSVVHQDSSSTRTLEEKSNTCCFKSIQMANKDSMRNSLANTQIV